MHLPARALLLDMDGVLTDSHAAVQAAWVAWAERRQLDLAVVTARNHGSPAQEVIAGLVPDDEVEAEVLWIEEQTLEGDQRPLPGAAAVLGQQHLPVAVVTSAHHRTAVLRLQRAGLPVPDVVVGADDVARGKPDPAGYLRAAELLGVRPEHCVAVEDSPTGVEAILAAGATPLALRTTRRTDQLGRAHAVVRDLSALRVDALGVHVPDHAGDEVVPDAQVVMDRETLLDASPGQVWPWLLQLGKGRAGWYLPRSAARFVPASRQGLRHVEQRWQQLAPGDVVPDWGGTFTVVEVDPGRALVYSSTRRRPGGRDALALSWALLLEPADRGRSRLHLRLRVDDVRHALVLRAADRFDRVTVDLLFAGLRERV